jgi:hypothetical protein
MSCDELNRLRAEATTLKERMDEQRRRARAMARQSRSGRPSGASELVPFLQRKLQRLAGKIERHVAQHRCQQ